MSSRTETARLRPALLCCFASCLLLAAGTARGAKTEQSDLSEMSLEDLLTLRVSVTSLVERPVDEAPGIVSVITREEIESSGARNLDDLLVFVPGVVPGQDEQNARGYGVRGLWAMEGKMLVLLDGVRLNEPLYGNTVFARQFSVDLIERIEIIRGPASSVYGEFGELAVVNIVTRGSNRMGGSATVTHGLADDAANRRVVSAGWGGRIGALDLSVNGIVGDGHLGNGDYTDKYDETIPLEDFSAQDHWLVNAGIGYKGLSARLIGSSLRQQGHLLGGLDSLGQNYAGPSRPITTSFDSYTLDAKYAWRPTPALVVTPRAAYFHGDSWKKDKDWVFDVVDDPYYARHDYRDFPDDRIHAGATAEWRLQDNMTVVLGGEYSHETIEARLPTVAAGDPWEYYYFYGDDKTKVTGETRSLYGEYDLRTRIADLTVGGRIDKNSRYDVAYLPRLGLTRRFGEFYLKGLASRGYHPPTLMTVKWLDPDIEPEYARDYEAEVGYKPSERALFRLNAFAIEMEPVIFYSGEFSNTTARSRGLEGEVRLQNRRGYLAATYSYYHAEIDDQENAMAADELGDPVDGVTLGFPAHKATLNGTVKFGRGFSLSPGLVWLGERYSRNSRWFWNGTEEDVETVNTEIDPTLLVNLYGRAVFLSGWEIGVGAFNLLDEKYSSLLGSYVGNPSVPGPSREFVARIGYSF